MQKTKNICVDLDGVLCNQTEGNYENATPNREAIQFVNEIFDQGHFVFIYTSRYMGRTNNNAFEAYNRGFALTKSQLDQWGVKYHALYMGKPRYDVIIDDRALFFRPDWQAMRHELGLDKTPRPPAPQHKS